MQRERENRMVNGIDIVCKYVFNGCREILQYTVSDAWLTVGGDRKEK